MTTLSFFVFCFLTPGVSNTLIRFSVTSTIVWTSDRRLGAQGSETIRTRVGGVGRFSGETLRGLWSPRLVSHLMVRDQLRV